MKKHFKLLTTCTLLVSTASIAAPPARPSALGRWHEQDGRTTIVIPLGETLTPKQKSILQAGFTAVSQAALWPSSQELNDSSPNAPKAYAARRCSIKFDAWAETYNITRLDGAPKSIIAKSIQDYSDSCLVLEITSSAILEALTPTGGELKATISIKQMTAEDAAKTKAWLVRQQSSLMQSLFTHMLGELDLNETEVVSVTLPPRPIASKSVEPGPL